MGIISYHAKGSYGRFQVEIFVKMSFSHHIYMFSTHFQSFMHYYTSVIIILTNPIVGIALVVSHQKCCCIKGSMFSYVLDDLCCITKFPIVWSQSSSITSHINSIDPTLSEIFEYSQQPSLIQPS